MTIDYGFGTLTPLTTTPPTPSGVLEGAAPPLPTTLLTLTQFARILGLDPLHFFGAYTDCRPKSAKCHDVWMQYQWQDAGKASRAEVARLIHEAEVDIANVVGYWPAWMWIADERHPLQRGGLAPNLAEQRLTLRWGYVISGGVMASTEAISASNVTKGANIDADGDGFAELAVFTLSAIPATWNLEDIRACFKEYTALDVGNCRTDPSSTDYDPSWEIRPLQLRRSGTTVTAYVPVWLLLKPSLQEACDAEAIDADAAASFVDTIRFYHVYNDVSTQVQYLWGTNACEDISCAWATQDGCIRVVDPRVSIVATAPGTYSEDCDCYTISSCWSQGTVPDAVRVWYKAGLARPAPGIMDHMMARLVAILACSRLTYPVCECGNVRVLVEEWRENAARATREQTFAMTPAMLQNPFGFHLGEVLVWNALNVPTRRIGRAVRT